MTQPDIAKLYEVTDATWPAARLHACGPFTLREGAGGGQRVSSATTERPDATEDEIAQAEEAMRGLGQTPLFMIREGQSALDARLAARGYDLVDPVNAYVAPIDALTDTPVPPVTAIPVWEPLALMCDIWAEGGIGPARIEVMMRACTPKTGIVARWNDHPGGCAFLAIHDGIAMVHAVEILEHQRQQGLGKWMMRRAAFWAADQGATHISVLCTRANQGANALYASLGMQLVGEYHYRKSKGTR